MKKIVNFFCAVILAGVPLSTVGQIAVSKVDISFDNGMDNSVVVTVKTDADWSCSCDADWLSVEKIGGTQLAVASLSVNNSIEPRRAAITLNAGTDVKVLTVTQAAAEQHLSASASEVTFPFKGGKKDVMISANMDWSITSCPKWCKVDSDGSYIRLDVEGNPGKKARTAPLIIKGADLDIVIVLKQRGGGILDKMKDKVEEVI